MTSLFSDTQRRSVDQVLMLLGKEGSGRLGTFQAPFANQIALSPGTNVQNVAALH